jgi:uncharacterized protein YukJ
MPLSSYGVLAGRVEDMRAEGGVDSPHFQILVSAGGQAFRIAVNVMSQESPSELLYLADERFDHPLLASLPALADGFTPVPSVAGGIALDLIRGNLLDHRAMTLLPADLPGPDNDLAERLAHFVGRAMRDPSARVYAFGERWGPEEGVADSVFAFTPGKGVHDIHMNQGNDSRFRADDGVWQDGGLMLSFPDTGQWVAVFLAFQGQAWHTDDTTGHSLEESEDAALRPIRITGALVNPVGPAPEAETVTLINASPAEVSLQGWSLVDRLAQVMPLDPTTVAPGDSIRVRLRPPLALGNQGGLLTLLDPTGQKVHGVSYSRDQARDEGWTVVF